MNQPDMTINAKAVRIHRGDQPGDTYPRLTVVIADLHLHASVVTDRQIRLAKLLAQDHGADFIVHPDLQARVDEALSTRWVGTKQHRADPLEGADNAALQLDEARLRIVELERLLRLATPHVRSCAEHDEQAAQRNVQIGMHGSADMCREQAEMRLCVVRQIEAAMPDLKQS